MVAEPDSDSPSAGSSGLPRHDVDDAADRVAAVEDGGGTANDLDRGDARDVDEAWLHAAEVDRLAAVVEPLAVDQDEHPVSAEAAQHGQAQERPFALDLEAGLQREEIGDHVVRLETVDPLAVEHVDGGRHVERRPLRAGGDRLDLLHEDGVRLDAALLRRQGSREGCEERDREEQVLRHGGFLCP